MPCGSAPSGPTRSDRQAGAERYSDVVMLNAFGAATRVWPSL